MSKILQDLQPKTHAVGSVAGIKELEFEVPAPRTEEAESVPRTQLERLLRLIAQRVVSWVPSKHLASKS